MKLLSTLGILLALFTSIPYIFHSNLTSLYIFSPTDLHALSLSAINLHGNNTAAIVSHILTSLSTTHAPYVTTHESWLLNNAGGAMGAMTIIHASLTEYLIIFGSAVGTEGHSGRHTADDYFHILSGEQLAYYPGKGEYEPRRFPQGSVHVLKRGEVMQYKMDGACFALEYARGWIPGMLGFGFVDSKFFSSLVCKVKGWCADHKMCSLHKYVGFLDADADCGDYGARDGGESDDWKGLTGLAELKRT
jgi:C-8 sterol isomerase